MRKTTTWTAALCAALLALHVVGCEHDSGSVAVESVTVNPPVLTLTRDGTARVTATVLPKNADDKTVTWLSSDPSVARVDYHDGMVTAVGRGTATITATTLDGNKTAACAVTVNPVPVESITLSIDTLTLDSTGCMMPTMTGLWATVLPENADNKTVTWSSSDPSVATVDDWGTVTAIAEGTAIITATTEDGGKTATCTVTVQPEALIAVESITLDKTTLTLTRGNTDWLGWGITPQNAHNKKILWSSSDPSVATIGDDGKVTAVTAGTAIITATTEDGGKTATCAVTVNPIAVENIWVFYCPPTLKLGTTGRIEVWVTPTNADATVRWSSSDPSVATVSDDGTVTAVKKGTATITAEAGGKRAERQITVTVDPIYVTSLTLAPETLRLKPGTTRTLTATVTPDNADDKTVVWSSSDPSVATVGDDGTVTAHALGMTNITAHCGNFWVTCRVTVSETLVEVERITLNKDSLTLTRGDTAQLTATVTPDNADNNTVTWSSMHPDIASVDADGTVRAVGQGPWPTTTITARADGKKAECHVIVNPIRVESVTLSKTALTLTRGETEKLTATITPDDPDDTRIAWSSSDPSVATVGSDGSVTAEGKGTATITATTLDGNKTATCAVTVNPIYVESITLDMTTLTLTRGDRKWLAATVTPGNADGNTVTWSSSDPSVATVNSGGMVTAVKAGTATITAQAGEKEATCAVTVNPIAVNLIELNKKTITLIRNRTEKLTATVWPANADDRTVAWSSSDTAVATVSNDGTVTAVKVGTATITAQAGEKTATCTVTVNPIRVERVTLNTTTLPIARGKTEKLTATVTPNDADDTTVTWSSSDKSVATVSNDGTVTAHKLGTATITAQADGKTATCTVTVRFLLMANGTIDDNGVLTEYSGSETTVDIPDGVTGIGEKAFENCTSLTNVTIPGSVTSIGGSAFSGCTNLTGVTILDGVTSIADYAFEWCTSLTDVTIPGSVTSIGESAFYRCTSLTDVTIPGSVTSIGNSAFKDCTRLTSVRYGGTLADWCSITWGDATTNPLSYGAVLYIGNEMVTDAVIPSSVTEIKNYAFYGCTSLTGVTIPNSVTSIGGSAFYGCKNLKSVTIPNSVTSIGESAFRGCTSLKSVSIPGSVTSIGDYAFYGCTGLTGMTIPNSVTSIGFGAFYGCTGLTSVTIPNSVTRIENSAFQGCTSLTTLTIPASVTSSAPMAFNDCTSLTNVVYGGTLAQWCANAPTAHTLMFYAKHVTMSDGTDLKVITKLVIPDGVTSIKDFAFYGCERLTNVTIPGSVTSIGYNAFKGCTNLKNVTIENGVTSIKDDAFKECTSLTDVTIPGSVTSIGLNAFYGCTSLTDVTIPGSVTYINWYTFYGCTSLKSVTIENGVTSIEYCAFSGCTGLTGVTIPDSVTKIADNAFSRCSSLTGVTIPGSVTDIGDYAFSRCSSLTSVTIPDSVTSIGESAFYECTSLTGVTIPDSVTSIGESAFYECTSLTGVTIPDSVTSIGEWAFRGCTNLTDVHYEGTKEEWERIQGISDSGLASKNITFAK